MHDPMSCRPGRQGTVIYAAILCSLFAASPSAAGEKDPDVARFEEIASADTLLMVPMRDGTELATDVYLPRHPPGPYPAIFVKTPYDFNRIEGSQLKWAIEAIERGYAFVVQNERGRYYSRGEWELLGKPRTDGYDSISWIADREWSNGSVGTLGCSSTAEWQMALAAMNHPAHKAMVPMAAGAGIGRVGEFMEQGNWHKGGVHQTLFTVWLYGVQQNLRPQFPEGLTRQQRQRLREMYDLAIRRVAAGSVRHGIAGAGSAIMLSGDNLAVAGTQVIVAVQPAPIRAIFAAAGS